MARKRQHKTEHPYIVRVQGVCGGQPVIKDTRLSVRHIAQLYKAGDTAKQGMAMLTYNARHFMALACMWSPVGREHAGLIVSEQFSQRQFGELLRRILRLLNNLTADEMHNRVVFLQQSGDIHLVPARFMRISIWAPGSYRRLQDSA